MGRFGKYPGLGWGTRRPLGTQGPTQKALGFSGKRGEAVGREECQHGERRQLKGEKEVTTCPPAPVLWTRWGRQSYQKPVLHLNP